jgi:hypothetical protein
MDEEQAAERAREKAYEFLHSLDLNDGEREEVRDLYLRLLKSLNDHRDFWKRVDDGQLRVEVLPSAPAMLTAYLDELVRAMRQGHQPPGSGRLRE